MSTCVPVPNCARVLRFDECIATGILPMPGMTGMRGWTLMPVHMATASQCHVSIMPSGDVISITCCCCFCCPAEIDEAEEYEEGDVFRRVIRVMRELV